MESETNPKPAPGRLLLRIPEVFADLAPEILARTGAEAPVSLAGGWHLVKLAEPARVDARADVSLFVPWRLPVEHSWPCCPEKTEQFIEKAAQALAKKFGSREPQALLIGPLDAGSPQRYYKTLASNLRGRALQVFPKLRAGSAEEQDPVLSSLFCLVGKEGLFAGMSTPRAAGGFHPGGVKFIRQGDGAMISRAGAKIAEALHWLRLHRDPLPPGSHWLELGASPGGMTGELLQRGYQVTAVDRAALDARLHRAPGLTFLKADATAFQPPPATQYDALLCDLNGPARASILTVNRLVPYLRPGGLTIFTLKTGDAETLTETTALCRAVETDAAAAGLALIGRTHLNYNRKEFTLCFEKPSGPGAKG
jgi:23S rRNA (cytidine2498-2'-O)-methyltransferase